MKSKMETAASSKASTPTSSPTKTSNSLTLEEKMRLAAAQENTNVMKRQSPLKAATAAGGGGGGGGGVIASSSQQSSFPSSSSSNISAPKNLTHTIAAPSFPLPRPLNPPPQNSITITPSRTGQVMSQMPAPKAAPAAQSMMQQQSQGMRQPVNSFASASATSTSSFG